LKLACNRYYRRFYPQDKENKVNGELPAGLLSKYEQKHAETPLPLGQRDRAAAGICIAAG
jgi:hypothetical protein